MMHKIAIIGAGQLGSRHLQGVLKSSAALEVYVSDPSESALARAEERANEISHSHRLIFLQPYEELPEVLDLVIIATNSNIRAMVLKKLLESRVVRYVVLEKVLFQSLNEYAEIATLLDKKGVRAFVNHPRRMFQFYQNLKEKLELKNKKDVKFFFYGQNWGLACNALHFLDLMVFLTDKQIDNIFTDRLDPQIRKSKREGYIEVSGTLNGTLEDKSTTFEMTSLYEDTGEFEPLTIIILSSSERVVIQEGANTPIVSLSKRNKFVPILEDYKILFQSDLSRTITEEILSKGETSLPRYSQARTTHEVFLKSLLKFYNLHTEESTTVCPIT